MSRERELDRDPQRRTEAFDAPRAPGRRTASARLDGPTHPIASGLVLRKPARDGNGVADGADTAVAAASSSSGAALPARLQRKFEASLGADLSSVRIHTGGASATAAHAVGARAYTVGQDIHFGAGHYDPASASGQHLIAHEVAHTVQQRGGAAVRQHKLEVSGPQDAAEHEADRAADAMVRGAPAAITGHAPAIARDPEEITFEDDFASPSSQMRNDGDQAVASFRRQPPSRAELGTTRADVSHAGFLIGQIDDAQGTLGMMQGREAAANKEGEEDQLAGHHFVPFNEASNAIAHNQALRGQLAAFQKSASRQDFQHTFFAQAYRQLQEDFLRLQSTVSVIQQQNLKVTGADAKADIEAAKKANPLLADAINGLKAAASDLDSTAASATAGIGAIASSAGGTFDQLHTETDAMKLPPPKMEDTAEQAAANGEVAKINADLEAAKATIGTIKSVVTTAFSLATGGASGEGMAIANEALAGLGKKAEAFAAKHVDHRTDGLRHTQGAKTVASTAQDKGVQALEGSLAEWMTNYSGRISAANGKVAALQEAVRKQYQAIQLDRVQNLQSQLADQVGKFALLLEQIEAKKQALADAAKKVQEQAKKEGDHGTNIGAAAQAMASVSSFLTQADAAENLGRQEQTQADDAQARVHETAGDFVEHREASAFPGGPQGLAETMPTDGQQAIYYLCKRAGDADERGTFDFSGYEVQEGKVVFTVNEDDVDQRSVVMRDRTEGQLQKVAQWKAEATGFKTAVADALGIGPSTLK